MGLESPKNTNKKFERFDKYFDASFPRQPLNPRIFLADSSDFGLDVNEAIDNFPYPPSLEASIRKALDTAQQAMFEVGDKLVMFRRITDEIDRLIVTVHKGEDEEQINKITVDFYKLLAKQSSNILAITYTFLSVSDSFQELLNFLDYALRSDVEEKLRDTRKYLVEDFDDINANDPLVQYLISVIPIDISGGLSSTAQVDIENAWRTRISYCIGVVNYLKDLRTALKSYKKFRVKEG